VKKLSALLSGAVAAALVATMGATAPSVASPDATPAPSSPTSTPTSTTTSSTTGSAYAAADATVDPAAVVGKKRRYKAPTGPYFNNPRGGLAAKTAIERKILEVLRHVPKGETARIALYSFDRIPVANALIAAHKRGVNIQMLLNDHQDTKAMKMVRGALGTNRKAKSFIYKCHWGCRSVAVDDRNLHSKFLTFTKSGRSEDVVVIGSANFMRNATHHQWNDMYFFNGDAAIFDQINATFKDMKKDYEKAQPPMYYCGTPVNGTSCDDSSDKYTNWVFPKPTSPKNDVVLDMLNKIQCLTPDGAGGQTRTKLDLSMHTIRGNRGNYLSAAIRQKFAEGCDFRVNYGLIGYQAKQILGAATPRGRIPLRSTGFDYNTEDNFDLNNDGEDDLILDRYTHQKYFLIDGTYNGKPGTKLVLTGSSNWASLGTAQDEMFFTILNSPGTYKRYLKNYDFMWKPGNSRNAYTTTFDNFRVATQVTGADGVTRTVYRTERRPVTMVLPDGHKAGGKFWEGD